jgi:hypothetical protein
MTPARKLQFDEVHAHPRNQEWIAYARAAYARRRALLYARTGCPNMARQRIDEAREYLFESVSLRKRSIVREGL